MSRREQIRMTDEEVEAFLAGRRVMSIASIGADGRPHLVAMWYGLVDGRPAFTTYGRSQKVVNLRRDPRLTGLVEDGETYDELRGVELVGHVEVVEDLDVVHAVGESVYERYWAEQSGPLTDETRPLLHATLRKRVALVLHVERTVSWDHRKLGGAY